MADALTADLPKTVATRPGSILLARHGEPDIARDVMLNARGYEDYWGRYEELGIRPGQTPPRELLEQAAKADVIISSVRRRSIESTQALVGGREFARNPIFVEAPLPAPGFPGFLKMSPKVWGFTARFWWWFFNHHAGQETRAEAEIRAGRAADRLVALADQGQDVLVVAHGFFNWMIADALKARGLAKLVDEGHAYWSLKRFRRP